MTETLALEYIKRKMNEIGVGDEYYIIPRMLVVRGIDDEIIKIDAFNQYFFLVDASVDIVVSSEFGKFDLDNDKINELQYLHQGQIEIYNRATTFRHAYFIQVIPKLN
jgi:hypothetical protein